MTSPNTPTAPASLDALIRALEAPDALVACEPWSGDDGMTLVRVVVSAAGLDVALDVECTASGEDEPVGMSQPYLHRASRTALEAAGLLPCEDRDPDALMMIGDLEFAVAEAHQDAIAAAARPTSSIAVALSRLRSRGPSRKGTGRPSGWEPQGTTPQTAPSSPIPAEGL